MPEVAAANIVIAHRDYNSPQEGYVTIRIGAQIEVLYRGSEKTDDVGWAYGRLGDHVGWFPSDVLESEAEPSADLESSSEAEIRTTIEAFSGPGGYLTVEPGEDVRILYEGSKGQDAGWLFGCHCGTEATGWLPASAVRRLRQHSGDEAAGLPLRPQSACEPQARSASAIPREDPVGSDVVDVSPVAQSSFAAASVKPAVGMIVEVRKDFSMQREQCLDVMAGDSVMVKQRQNSSGWVLVERCGIHVKKEQGYIPEWALHGDASKASAPAASPEEPRAPSASASTAWAQAASSAAAAPQHPHYKVKWTVDGHESLHVRVGDVVALKPERVDDFVWAVSLKNRSEGWLPEASLESLDPHMLLRPGQRLLLLREDDPSPSSSVRTHLRREPKVDSQESDGQPPMLLTNAQSLICLGCHVGEWVLVQVQKEPGKKGFIRLKHLVDADTGRRLQAAASRTTASARGDHAADLRPSRNHGEFAPAAAPSSCTLDIPDRVVPEYFVRIWTFGLEHLDDDLLNQVREHGQRGGADAKLPAEALKEALERHVPDGRMDHVYDMRLFADADMTLYKHIGIHPEILDRMQKAQPFDRFLTKLGSEVQQVFERKKELRVAFYCKSGKHRSVAGAKFLQHIAEREGWSCRVEHLSRYKSWKTTCKGTCEECKEGTRSELRESALERAWQRWNDSR